MNSPIAIKIKDKGKYADVASVVDRDDFLNDVLFLRKRKKLKRLLPYNSNQHWASDSIWGASVKDLEKYNDAIAPFEEVLQNTNATSELPHEERVVLMRKFKKADRILPGNAFQQDIQKIRRKYHKSTNFDRIIAHAVLYGEIRDEDYVTCEIDIDYPEVDIVDCDREPKPVITFYPHVHLKDIQELLKKNLEYILQKYQKEVLGGKLVTYDPKSSIERDREWYWMWKDEREKGRGAYNRIANLWNESGQGDYIEDINLIEQGVSRYRKFLNADI